MSFVAHFTVSLVFSCVTSGDGISKLTRTDDSYNGWTALNSKLDYSPVFITWMNECNVETFYFDFSCSHI